MTSSPDSDISVSTDYYKDLYEGKDGDLVKNCRVPIPVSGGYRQLDVPFPDPDVREIKLPFIAIIFLKVIIEKYTE